MGLACEAVWREVCTRDSLFSHHHIVTTQPELTEHSGPSNSMLKHGTRFDAATAREKESQTWDALVTHSQSRVQVGSMATVGFYSSSTQKQLRSLMVTTPPQLTFLYMPRIQAPLALWILQQGRSIRS